MFAENPCSNFFSNGPQEKANRDNSEKCFSYRSRVATMRVASHMRLAQAVCKNDIQVITIS
jgi:hypothetical protein